jgi:hypothetical protein
VASGTPSHFPWHSIEQHCIILKNTLRRAIEQELREARLTVMRLVGNHNPYRGIASERDEIACLCPNIVHVRNKRGQLRG